MSFQRSLSQTIDQHFLLQAGELWEAAVGPERTSRPLAGTADTGLELPEAPAVFRQTKRRAKVQCDRTPDAAMGKPDRSVFNASMA